MNWKIRLHDDWKRILARAHSVRLMLGGLGLETAIEVVPYVGDYVPRWAVIALLVGALLARVLKQQTLAPNE